MKVILVCCTLLSGCASHSIPPVTGQLPETKPIRMGISQIGCRTDAAFVLRSDCPVPTRKVLAPLPLPLKLTEALKAKPVKAVPKEERITHTVHFPLPSSLHPGDQSGFFWSVVPRQSAYA